VWRSDDMLAYFNMIFTSKEVLGHKDTKRILGFGLNGKERALVACCHVAEQLHAAAVRLRLYPRQRLLCSHRYCTVKPRVDKLGCSAQILRRPKSG
jgi:hypothetical protein